MSFALRSIVLREIRLPLREPFRISSGVEHERRILLLQLESSDGSRAWAECVAGSSPNYTPETIDTAWLALREYIWPRVVGRAWSSAREIASLLADNLRGHNMARAAVEMGCWGLEAEATGRSLASLIGGSRGEVETGISLGIQETPGALADKALQSRDIGYRKVKLKIQPGADVEFVCAVRDALGGEATLAVDANSAYSLEDLDVLRQLDELDLLMIEQPLAWDDLVRHARLQKELKTAICLDESITGVERVEDMLALGSGRIVNIKPGRVAGFSGSIAIHDLCSSAGVPVWCGGMLESGIGRAYNVALASLPGFTLPGDLSPSRRYWAQDVVAPEWEMSDQGMVTVPEGAGIGVNVLVDRIDDLTVRSETLSR